MKLPRQGPVVRFMHVCMDTGMTNSQTDLIARLKRTLIRHTIFNAATILASKIKEKTFALHHEL
jgi:hypothetical protein